MAGATGLATEQQRALDRLRDAEDLPATYVAGGVAVAFHLSHRTSRDIDRFTFDAAASLDPFRSLARTDPSEVEVTSGTDVALHLRVHGTPVDIVRYPYPLLEPPGEGPRGWPVAGLLDLATMKLAAIAKRGLRRDFWDLKAIVEAGITLPDAGEAYVRRFGKAESDLYHVWRSLTYFDDAERDPAFPLGMTQRKWEAIRRFFEDRAAELIP